MFKELDANFVAAVKKCDVDAANRLKDVSGLSNQNTWFHLYTLLNDIPETEVGLQIWKLLLSEANEKIMTNILRAAVHNDQDYVIRSILATRPIANMNAVDVNGNSFLHIAVQRKNEAVVEILCNEVTEIDAKNKEGNTALHLAASYGNYIMTYLLLNAGAKCDETDNLGRTPLHIASEKNNRIVIDDLLSFGADINVISHEDRTPVDCGKKAKFFKEHIIAMHVLGRKVIDRNLDHIDFEGVDLFMFQDYQKKIELLKSQKFGDSRISVYNFLTCDPNRLTLYTKIEHRVHLVDETSWPKYFSQQFRKRIELGKERKRLLKASLASLATAFIYLLGQPLPEIGLAYQIADYLSNKDLENLIEATASEKRSRADSL